MSDFSKWKNQILARLQGAFQSFVPILESDLAVAWQQFKTQYEGDAMSIVQSYITDPSKAGLPWAGKLAGAVEELAAAAARDGWQVSTTLVVDLIQGVVTTSKALNKTLVVSPPQS